MIVECSHCGAPLSVKDGDRFVTCSYCDKTNRVRSLRTVEMKASEVFQPPKVHVPPAHVPAASSQPLTYHQGTKHKVTAATNQKGCGCWGLLFLLPICAPIAANVPWTELPLVSELPFVPGLHPEQPPTVAAVDGSQPHPGEWPGTAVGEISASELGEGCRGWVPELPHLRLTLRTPTEVRVTTASNADLVMLVRDEARNTICDDDSGEANQPLVSRVLPPGTHYVWVGPYHEAETVPFLLRLATTPLDFMPDPDGLAASMAPTLGTLDLATLPHGTSVAGTVQGHVPVPGSDRGCRGFVPRMPHLVVRVAGGSPTTVTTSSSTDLTLFMRLANGVELCDDDSGDGTQPLLHVPPIPGDAKVWVGVFHENEQASFDLRVTPFAIPPG